MIKLKFWGVRGSIPCPGPTTVKYGGNTACLELRFGPDDRLVIIDAGSGIRDLGNSLLGTDLPKGPLKIDLFLTHTHWDHIMGFPFFTPNFIPGTRMTVYGPVTYENASLEEIVGGQLSYRYFPVKHSELGATISYRALKECVLNLGDGLNVRTKYLNHPILCLGYRFEYEGYSVCTAYDTEPFRNLFPEDPEDPNYDETAAREGALVAQEENDKITRFFTNADLVIYDSQYTAKEYKEKFLGWGHSYFEHVINTAHKAGVKHLVFFHHDPQRTDEELDKLLAHFKAKLKGKSEMTLSMAREGETIEIPGGRNGSPE